MASDGQSSCVEGRRMKTSFYVELRVLTSVQEGRMTS